MNRFFAGIFASTLLGGMWLHAQAPLPYKLGTFERGGRPFVGVVLRDAMVVDLAAANERLAGAAKPVAPADMKDLIARYDRELRPRIVEIVKGVSALPEGQRPDYVHDLKALKTLPPIMYPRTMVNVALNYRSHAVEMGTPGGDAPELNIKNTRTAPGVWERRPDDPRWNPYMFLKASSAVIADGEAVRLPSGRNQIDWECELGVVIGRQAAKVPIAQAADHIFGYTIELDVSDRGGRGDDRYGSDWLVAKSQDTFAPLGPFIVPKEFVPDVQKLGIKYLLNGQLMQDSNTSLMIHTVVEQVHFASNILTLVPGDVIATGTPPGVGSGRKPPVYFKTGDLSVCTYEGVGTLTNPVK